MKPSCSIRSCLRRQTLGHRQALSTVSCQSYFMSLSGSSMTSQHIRYFSGLADSTQLKFLFFLFLASFEECEWTLWTIHTFKLLPYIHIFILPMDNLIMTFVLSWLPVFVLHDAYFQYSFPFPKSCQCYKHCFPEFHGVPTCLSIPNCFL